MNVNYKLEHYFKEHTFEPLSGEETKEELESIVENMRETNADNLHMTYVGAGLTAMISVMLASGTIANYLKTGFLIDTTPAELFTRTLLTLYAGFIGTNTLLKFRDWTLSREILTDHEQVLNKMK